MQDVLAQVQWVVDQDDVENRQQVARLAMDMLASMITDFHMPRLDVYRKKIMKDLIQPCHEVLAEYCKKNGK